MGMDFEKLTEELQKSVMEDIRKKYAPAVIDHWMYPRNFRRLEGAGGQAVITGPCGDTMEIYVRVADGRIAEATFFTDGCGTTIACGSMLSTMVLGKSLQEAGAVGPAELMVALGGLPEESEHCAELAVQTLRQAIASCRAEHGSREGRYGN